MGEQVPMRFVLMRGGTSKAVFLRQEDLPPDRADWGPIILALFGSPDPRQVDGLGGADLLTSKLAIIGRPSRPDADLDYTFAQVSITEPVVDYDINCGNISAAVGAYAVDEGFVGATAPTTRVRIHNTNTGRILTADVPVWGGRAAVDGDLAIDGVPGTGARILLDYRETAGGATGALLPTGLEVDLLPVSGLLEPVEASIVDIGNLCVFFAAKAVGLTGTEGPSEVGSDRLGCVAEVKAAAARLIGIAGDGLVPVPVAVAAPATYTAYGSGDLVPAEAVDLVARVFGGRPPVLHKAFPGTVGVCTAIAASIPGTVVSEVAFGANGDDAIPIGHPSGVFPVWARVGRDQEGRPTVERAAYARTARRLAEGTAWIRRAAWPAFA